MASEGRKDVDVNGQRMVFYWCSPSRSDVCSEMLFCCNLDICVFNITAVFITKCPMCHAIDGFQSIRMSMF